MCGQNATAVGSSPPVMICDQAGCGCRGILDQGRLGGGGGGEEKGIA